MAYKKITLCLMVDADEAPLPGTSPGDYHLRNEAGWISGTHYHPVEMKRVFVRQLTDSKCAVFHNVSTTAARST